GNRPAVSVCALVPYPPNTAPSQRYRIEQWLPHLNGRGIIMDLFPFADLELMELLHKPGRRLDKAGLILSACARRFGTSGFAARNYDAVVIHRGISLAGPALIETALAMLGTRVIFDFDDAIYLLHTTDANKRFGWLKFPGKTAAICRLSNHVVVGNSYLASYARGFNRNVTVVPTSVDTARYKPAGRPSQSGKPGKVIVGWTGSSTSQTHLEMFSPMLARLTAIPNVELRVISDRQPVLPGVKHVWRPWSSSTEIEELAPFDIGIMPMPDDEWSKGKCSLKALVYMAMGIPAVCSPVGANLDIIRHGVNGMLASPDDEWIENLTALVESPDLRKTMGALGRKTVVERFSMKRSADLFADVILDTVKGRSTVIRD
ncbi:MAG TPA: glycosyltransferase family 4 protein, partial [Blastocatellia bacterium]|nr:glycosyltransferase family 4 protein [Blastocatellia bacterium]